MTAFPPRCPDCGALLMRRPWVDPLTFRSYTAVVHHDGACPCYRERRYDRAEPVAHLMAVGGVRS